MHFLWNDQDPWTAHPGPRVQRTVPRNGHIQPLPSSSAVPHPRRQSQKHHMLSIGTFNCRTLKSDWRLQECARLAHDLKLFVLSVQEHRRTTELDCNLKDGWHFKGSPASNSGVGGIGFILSPSAMVSLLNIQFKSPRIGIASFDLGPRRLHVFCAYSPTAPQTLSNPLTSEQHYEEISSCLLSIPRRDITLVSGDFNAPLLPDGFSVLNRCGTPTANSPLLEGLIGSNNLVTANGRLRQKFSRLCTFIGPRKRHTRLDWILAPARYKYQFRRAKSVKPTIVLSDHKLVSLTLNVKWPLMKRLHTPRLPLWLSLYNKDTRASFVNVVQKSMPLSSPCYDTFKEAIHKAATALPKRHPLKESPSLWLNDPHITAARRRLKISTQRFGTTSQESIAAKDVLKRLYTEKSDLLVNDAVRESEAASAQSKHATAWRIINRLTGRRVHPKTVIAADSISHRKKLVADHYKDILNANQMANVLLAPPLPPLLIPGPNSYNCEEISSFEVCNALKSARADGAPGPDKIPIRVLKLEELSSIITLVLNSSCSLGKSKFIASPPEWHFSEIVSIPKKGTSTALDNQRGISLMCTLAKVLNRILLNRISPLLNPLLLSLQAGFRPGRSTTEQVVALRIIIDDCTTHQRSLAAVFVDFKKAFDSVTRSSIPIILSFYGVPDILIEAVMELYNNTSASVRTSHGPTDTFCTSSGVLQGDTLAPFLFVVTLDYVLRQSLKDEDAYQSSSSPAMPLQALAYADDIALLCRDSITAQSQVSRLFLEAMKIGLHISSSKTEVLYIGTDASELTLPNNERIKVCQDFRYLGISVLHPDTAFNERYSQAWKACHSLSCIFNSDATDATKTRLFKAVIEPILCYGMECIPVTKTRGDRIDIAHRRLLRFCFRIQYPTVISNSDLMRRTNTSPLTKTLMKRRINLIAHCLRNDIASFNTGAPRIPLTIAFNTPPQEKFRRGMGRYSTLRSQCQRDISVTGLTPAEIGTLKRGKLAELVRSL
jgi:sorting nexin-29